MTFISRAGSSYYHAVRQMLEIRGQMAARRPFEVVFCDESPSGAAKCDCPFSPVIKTMTRSFCEPSAAICGKDLPGLPTLISEAPCHQGDVSIDDSGTGNAKRFDRGVTFPGI
jgi:hypothetical protein